MSQPAGIAAGDHAAVASAKRKGLRGSPGLTLLAAALGVMMVALDGTIVAVANPAIQAHLGASLADIQWVTNGYLLALAVTLITIGKIGDRFGHKKIFLAGITGFAATSAAVGLSGDIAGSIALIIAFRVLQGVFGAMLQPTALALLRETFPIEKLNGAIGIWGAVIGASTAAGPIVGGLLVQHVNWEACFYINVPVGIVALAFGLLVLRETPPSPAARSFDIPGIAALTAFLFLLVWALIKGPGYGWGSATTITYFAGAVVALAVFIVREARAKAPLLPLKLFRSVPLSAGTALVLMLMFSLFGAMFFMTFFMENVHGTDAIGAGVRLLPLTGMLMLGAPLAGVVIARTGPRVPMFAGMLLAAVALFGLSRISMTSGMNDTIVWFALLGLGLSPVMVGGTEVIVGNAPVELAGVAAGLQSTAMQVGGTIGTAVLGAVMSGRVDSLLPANWAAAHLPALTPAQLAGVKELTAVGVAPTRNGIPPQLAATMADVTHATFISGMTASFLVACVVAVGGALIALLTRKGHAVRELADRAAGKMGGMDIDQAIEYVRLHHHAVLATLKKDGSPQLSPVAAGVDSEGRVVISTRETAYKVRHIRRDPRVWLCVFPDGFYGRWAQLEGTTEILELPGAMDGLISYYRGISGEHPDWDDYRAAMERERRVLLRITVAKAGPNVSG